MLARIGCRRIVGPAVAIVVGWAPCTPALANGSLCYNPGTSATISGTACTSAGVNVGVGCGGDEYYSDRAVPLPPGGTTFSDLGTGSESAEYTIGGECTAKSANAAATSSFGFNGTAWSKTIGFSMAGISSLSANTSTIDPIEPIGANAGFVMSAGVTIPFCVTKPGKLVVLRSVLASAAICEQCASTMGSASFSVLGTSLSGSHSSDCSGGTPYTGLVEVEIQPGDYVFSAGAGWSASIGTCCGDSPQFCGDLVTCETGPFLPTINYAVTLRYYPGTQACPGDVDGDQDVDLADLSALLASYGCSFGMSCFNPDADWDGDGDIDLADLATLFSHFGQTCP